MVHISAHPFYHYHLASAFTPNVQLAGPYCTINMAQHATEDDSYRKAHAVSLFVFSFLATVAVVLRIWGRKIQQQALMLNDYLTALGLVSRNDDFCMVKVDYNDRLSLWLRLVLMSTVFTPFAASSFLGTYISFPAPGCCFPFEWKSTTQSEDIKLSLQVETSSLEKE